jgi:hypothetical protein
MRGRDYLIELQPLSLSNDTIRQRIQDMAYDILSQVVDEIKSCPSGMFIIQLVETTDVTNLAQLLVYGRYVYNDDIKTEFLLCKPLETTTTTRDIFKVVSNLFEERGIEWKHLCAVCTDGAPAMLGCRSGFQALIKTVAPNAIGTHCVIHSQVLAAKTLPSGLKQIVSLAIQAVNFIKIHCFKFKTFHQAVL